MQKENFKMYLAPKFIMAVILILVLGAVAIVSILRERIINPLQNQVTITGQGKIFYQPDMATIIAGVQIDKAEKADLALNQLSERITKIVAAVKKAGIAEADIQTQTYTLFPNYEYLKDENQLSGYNANQQLNIIVRDLKNNDKKVSGIIAELSKAGANQINGVSFNVSNLNDLKQQARIAAILDAKNKAQALASAAGVKLCKVVGWYENIAQAPSNYYDGKGGAGGAISAQVPSGLQEIIIEIGVNYEVK